MRYLAGGPLPDDGPFPLRLHSGCGYQLPEHLAARIRALAPVEGPEVHVEIHSLSMADVLAALRKR